MHLLNIELAAMLSTEVREVDCKYKTRLGESTTIETPITESASSECFLDYINV